MSTDERERAEFEAMLKPLRADINDNFSKAAWFGWQARAKRGTPTPAQAPAQPVAWSDVIAERQRQVAVEGWTSEHDDAHPAGDFERAAATYALYSYGVPGSAKVVGLDAPYLWPWDWKWLKPKGMRRDLVRAAALLLAAIEKYDREADKRDAAIAKGEPQP